MHGNVVDIVGKKFNRLTVLEYLENSKWLCRCDCGNFSYVTTHRLKSGNTKSCGCLRIELLSKEPGVAAFNKLYQTYKLQARRRDYKFDLTKEQFHTISSQDCHYCGKLPSQVTSSPVGDYIYNGLDRKDNLLGYTLDNCLPCCADCNRAKLELSYEEFLTLVERIYINLELGYGYST